MMYKKIECVFTWLLVVCVACGTALADLDEGLISHWPMDEGSGRVIHDRMGVGDGQLFGPANWTEGYLNEGLWFPGDATTSTYGAVPADPAYDEIKTALTLSCWVLPDPDTENFWNPIVMRGHPEVSETWNLAWLSNNAINFRTSWDDNRAGYLHHFRVGGPADFLDGNWHHVAGTYDGTTKIVYCDGVELQRTTIQQTTGVIISTNGRIIINNLRDAEEPPTGLMGRQSLDDLRVYKRALTPEEVAELAGADQVFTGKAIKPNPIEGGTTTATSIQLSWWEGRRTADDFAKSDIVYCGTDFNAVQNGEDSVKLGQTEEVHEWNVENLVPGQIYYWRIDEVYADGQLVPGYVWQFTVLALKATAPTPLDGDSYVDPGIEFNWTPGIDATSHAFHLGTDQAAVAAASTDQGLVLMEPNHAPGTPLELDTTYYWRVDEITDSEETTVGDVWSFTTPPVIPIVDEDLLAWYKLDEISKGHIIDSSGYHHHGTVFGTPALVDAEDEGKAMAFSGGSDQFCKLSTWNPIPDNNLTVTLRAKWAGSSGFDQCMVGKRDGTFPGDMVFSFYADAEGAVCFTVNGRNEPAVTSTGGPMAVDVWEHWAVTVGGTAITIYRNGSVVGTGSDSWGTKLTAQILLGAMESKGDTAAATFNGALDDVRIYKRALSSEEIAMSLRKDLNQAWNPSPFSGLPTYLGLGATTLDLTWSPGDMAAQHQVYFSVDPNTLGDESTLLDTVTDATIASPVLGFGVTHYWRVDEVNTDGTVTEGAVWKLVIADDLLVDDFEDYDYVDNAIWFTWKDGFGWDEPAPRGSSKGNGTGSLVDINDVAASGAYSMWIAYDNTGTSSNVNGDPITATYSEVQRTWAGPQDLTQGGYNALVLSVHGNSGNAAAPLYVALESAGESAVLYHDDPNTVLLADSWNEWAIELGSITAVDLTAVSKMAIGIGEPDAAGGNGILLVDRIMLANREFIAPDPNETVE
ncbi:LamG domain-containing protein [Planctomycetota bacterium]